MEGIGGVWRAMLLVWVGVSLIRHYLTMGVLISGVRQAIILELNNKYSKDLEVFMEGHL